MNKIITTPEKIYFKKLFRFNFKTCLTRTANPIEPKIITPTEANNSNRTNAELM